MRMGEDGEESDNGAEQLSPESKRIKKEISINIWICYATSLLIHLSTATTIPSLWPYIRSLGAQEIFLGWIVSAYSLGQIVGSLFFGWCYTRFNNGKIVMLVALVIIVIGDAFYGLIPNKWVILACRFVEGFGLGLQAVAQAYLSSVTTATDRTSKLSGFNFATSLSFIVGPACTFVLSMFSFKVLWFSVDSYTAPGFFSAFVALIDFGLMFYFFKEHTQYELDQVGLSKPLDHQPLLSENPNSPSSSPQSRTTFMFSGFLDHFRTLNREMIYLVVVMCFIYFLTSNCLAVYETITTPVTEDNFGWEVKENSVLWAAIGCMSATGNLIFTLAARRRISRDDIVFVVSNCVLTLAFALLVHFQAKLPLWRFVVGTVFVSFFYPIIQTVGLAVYSKMLGKVSQGFFIGLLLASAAFARLIGPLWAGAVYQEFGEAAVYGATAAGLAISLITFLVLFRRISKAIQPRSS